MTHPSGTKVSPDTGFIRKVANKPDRRDLTLSSVQHSPRTESYCHSRSPKRGPTRPPLPGNQLHLRIGNMPPWCLPARFDTASFYRRRHTCFLLRPEVLGRLPQFGPALALSWSASVLWFLRLLIFAMSCLDTTDSKSILSVILTPSCGPQGTDFTTSHFCFRGRMSVDTRK